MKLFLSIAFIFVTSAVVEVLAQTAPDPFSVTQLFERLSIIHGGSGYGAHVGVCEGDDGLLLIDAMLSSSAPRLDKAIKSMSSKPVKWVINTHGHSDHAGGNAYFSDRGATIIADEATRYGASQVHLRTKGGFALNYCGETIMARPFIAHTYGDLLIYFEDSNVLFMGDTFANAYYPSGYARGRFSELASVKAAKGLADGQTAIVPGHGFIDDVSGLDRYADLVSQWYDRVSELTASKSSVDDMLGDAILLKLSGIFLEHSTVNFDKNVRFERFIRRTLSTDFIQRTKLTAQERDKFLGQYHTAQGAPIDVTMEGNRHMLIKQDAGFIEEIIPIGHGIFHIRGALEGQVSFSFEEDDGAAQSITIQSGDFVLMGKRAQ